MEWSNMDDEKNNMNKQFIKYEMLSFLLFINACTWVLLEHYFNIFSTTEHLWFTIPDVILTIIGIIKFTKDAASNLEVSEATKKMLVTSQLLCLFIIYIIYIFIAFRFIGFTM